MYKIVKDLVDAPVLLMMCDAPCACVVQAPVPEGDPSQAEPAFIQAARQQGWFVSLGRQLCPHHHVALRAERPLVQPARSVLIS